MEDWEDYSGENTYYVIRRSRNHIEVLTQPISPLENGIVQVFENVNWKMLNILRGIESDPSQSEIYNIFDIKSTVKARIAYLEELNRQTLQKSVPVIPVRRGRR